MKHLASRRLLWIGLILLALGLAAVRCTPHKRVDPDSRITPVAWLSEDSLVIERAGMRVVRDTVTGKETPAGVTRADWQVPVPRIEPRRTDYYAADDPRRNRVINGREINLAWDRYRRGDAGTAGFPPRDFLPVTTWHTDADIGILTRRDGALVLVPLPLLHPENRTRPVVQWDAHAGRYLAYQAYCRRFGQDPSCPRTGWWLSPQLELIDTFSLPGRDLLYLENMMTPECFSCGCGCYIREEFYPVGGKIYVHIAGFPIPEERRGIYRISEEAGTPRWQQIIAERLAAPLAISPSGCRVAGYRVSWFGDSLEIMDLCPGR